MADFTPVPGTSDIYGVEAEEFRLLEDCAAAVFSRYGYRELRTPIFEYTELFTRGLGGDTEVVQKEMYTFLDRGGRSLTLRPEGTAGVMRSLIGRGVASGNSERVYYMGPMFRGERPAAGRKRQFHQIGTENVGVVSPELDGECIAMMMDYIEKIGIKESTLKINTRGIAADRVAAGELLRQYFRERLDAMCPDCRVRFEKNIWRMLDCKVPGCREVVAELPDYHQAFCDESVKYFNRVCEVLDALEIKYQIDKFLVRGLDYYVHTVFELTSDAGLGAQNAIAGGGRYELFLPGENKPVIGVGFAAGMERLILTREAQGAGAEENTDDLIYLVGLGEDAHNANIILAHLLRKSGQNVALDIEGKSFKSQMRSANRLNARTVYIRGDEELAKNTVIRKDMTTGTQEEIKMEDIYPYA